MIGLYYFFKIPAKISFESGHFPYKYVALFCDRAGSSDNISTDIWKVKFLVSIIVKKNLAKLHCRGNEMLIVLLSF